MGEGVGEIHDVRRDENGGERGAKSLELRAKSGQHGRTRTEKISWARPRNLWVTDGC